MSIEKTLNNWDKLKLGKASLVKANCFEVLKSLPENSIHAVVTDPPYGLKEYELEQINKMKSGKGGIWRIPPSFDGNIRSPLPRFTALDNKERERLVEFFYQWSVEVNRVLRPGGHLILASNTFLSNMIFSSISNSGLEFRGEIIRLVRTLRGGDRPKNHEEEFPNVCSLPRGCYEPWGVFRKELPKKMTVAQCLREYKTGGLRRLRDGNPFNDVIPSERTTKLERDIANHPSLKPQSFMRQVVRASLPLGEGVVLDPFMGAGTTIAAANFLNYESIGIERDPEYFEIAVEAIPELQNIGLSTKNRTAKSESQISSTL